MSANRIINEIIIQKVYSIKKKQSKLVLPNHNTYFSFRINT